MTHLNNSVYQERGPVSIPSRFEVVQNPRNSVKDGFGSCSSRFSNRTDSKPGPGQYCHKDLPLKDPTSFSKKGYGSGFVSKTTRFSRVAELQQASVPGPGHYREPAGAIRAGSKRPRSQQPHSTVRARAEMRERRAVRSAQPPPGPGTYDTYQNEWVQSSRTFASSFRSKAQRQPKNKAAISTPAPGAYFTPTNYIRGNVAQMSAAFRSGTDRQGTMYASSSHVTPGPGDYSPVPMSSKLDFHRQGNINVLRPGASIRRNKIGARGEVKVETRYVNERQQGQSGSKGSPKAHTSYSSTSGPGPGSYYTDVSTLNPNVGGAQSAFRSRTKRNAVNRERRAVPGPAFYSANPLVCKEKRSFLLNTTEKWL